MSSVKSVADVPANREWTPVVMKLEFMQKSTIGWIIGRKNFVGWIRWSSHSSAIQTGDPLFFLLSDSNSKSVIPTILDGTRKTIS